ncbi:hypothetical protein EV182_001818, partial [Spiromyces aspiralis]
MPSSIHRRRMPDPDETIVHSNPGIAMESEGAQGSPKEGSPTRKLGQARVIPRPEKGIDIGKAIGMASMALLGPPNIMNSWDARSSGLSFPPVPFPGLLTVWNLASPMQTWTGFTGRNSQLTTIPDNAHMSEASGPPEPPAIESTPKSQSLPIGGSDDDAGSISVPDITAVHSANSGGGGGGGDIPLSALPWLGKAATAGPESPARKSPADMPGLRQQLPCTLAPSLPSPPTSAPWLDTPGPSRDTFQMQRVAGNHVQLSTYSSGSDGSGAVTTALDAANPELAALLAPQPHEMPFSVLHDGNLSSSNSWFHLRHPIDYVAPLKKPMNSFLLFSTARRLQLRDTNPELKTTEQSTLLAKEWASLPEETKKLYRSKARQLRADYDARRAEFSLKMQQHFSQQPFSLMPPLYYVHPQHWQHGMPRPNSIPPISIDTGIVIHGDSASVFGTSQDMLDSSLARTTSESFVNPGPQLSPDALNYTSMASFYGVPLGPSGYLCAASEGRQHECSNSYLGPCVSQQRRMPTVADALKGHPSMSRAVGGAIAQEGISLLDRLGMLHSQPVDSTMFANLQLSSATPECNASVVSAGACLPSSAHAQHHPDMVVQDSSWRSFDAVTLDLPANMPEPTSNVSSSSAQCGPEEAVPIFPKPSSLPGELSLSSLGLSSSLNRLEDAHLGRAELLFDGVDCIRSACSTVVAAGHAEDPPTDRLQQQQQQQNERDVPDVEGGQLYHMQGRILFEQSPQSLASPLPSIWMAPMFSTQDGGMPQGLTSSIATAAVAHLGGLPSTSSMPLPA